MNTTIINTEVLPFKATAFHAGKFVPVSEADLKGKWSVVFFYPADFTFVCPTELGDLADNYAEFKKLGVEIYGVSTDTHFTHKAWHDTSETIGKIQYPMIGDPTGVISRNFGVMIEEAGLAEQAGAIVARREVAESLADKFVFHTYGANPVACAAAEDESSEVARHPAATSHADHTRRLIRILPLVATRRHGRGSVA